MLMVAALTATFIAPAQAGPSNEPLVRVINASMPRVPVADLIDPQGKVVLAQPDIADDQSNSPADVLAKPIARLSGDLASMVAKLRGAVASSRELECLATGIYFESKSEPLAGQLAVGHVIANRASSHGRFPSSYCGVLCQRGQFSFVRGHSLPSVPRSGLQWKTAMAIAQIVDQGLKASSVGNALFFHARYVSPAWRLKKVASIGNHIFYR